MIVGDTLDAQFGTLFAIGTDPLAYTDAATLQADRVTAKNALLTTLGQVAGVASADIAAASFGTAAGLLGAVDAAGRLAQAVTAQALLAGG